MFYTGTATRRGQNPRDVNLASAVLSGRDQLTPNETGRLELLEPDLCVAPSDPEQIRDLVDRHQWVGLGCLEKFSGVCSCPRSHLVLFLHLVSISICLQPRLGFFAFPGARRFYALLSMASSDARLRSSGISFGTAKTRSARQSWLHRNTSASTRPVPTSATWATSRGSWLAPHTPHFRRWLIRRPPCPRSS